MFGPREVSPMSKKRSKLKTVGGEIARNAVERDAIERKWPYLVGDTPAKAREKKQPKLVKDYKYVDELAKLQLELVKLQEWVRIHGLRVAVIFEGRDAAGRAA